MTAISAFRVKQHGRIFSLFFRNRIQCIALYQLHNSQAMLNLCLGYFSDHDIVYAVRTPGGWVLRFAVIRGRADFQGRLFDPKYFRQGANLSFN